MTEPTAASGSADNNPSSSSSSSSSSTAPTIYQVFDRRLNLTTMPVNASIYSMLRAWVQDDPLRPAPWYVHVKKEAREGGKGSLSSSSSLYFSSSAEGGGGERVGGGGDGVTRGFVLPPPLPETAMTLLKEGSTAAAAPPPPPLPSPAPIAAGTAAAASITPTVSTSSRKRGRNDSIRPTPGAPKTEAAAAAAAEKGGLIIDSLRHVPTETLLDLHVGFFRQVRKGWIKARERRVGRFRHRLALLGLVGGGTMRRRRRRKGVVEEQQEEEEQEEEREEEGGREEGMRGNSQNVMEI